MADIGIRWQPVEKISKAPTAVVTGEDATEPTEASADESTLLWTDKPLLIFVCDEAAGCEGFDKLEEVVLKDEKVALAMKAFRTVKMHPDDVELDPLIKDEGKTVPRMIFIEPVKMKVRVLEERKLKVSALFNAMKKTANGFWKENLTKIVKAHQKLLQEQDKLANELKTAEDQKSRLDEDDEGSSKAKKIAEQLAEIAARKQELSEEKAALWKLTPKSA